jgi:hypothetical protein
MAFTEFFVSDKHEIPFNTLNRGARLLPGKKVIAQWMETNVEEFNKTGCYILTVGTTLYQTPIYVGRTTKKSFKFECFTARNINFLNFAMNKKTRQIPYLFLVVPQSNKGVVPQKKIEEIEAFLINQASIRNTDFFNTQNPNKGTWRIRGVHNSGKGQSNKASKQFNKMIGI